jgi:DNA-binding Xre family transcriptional regulator
MPMKNKIDTLIKQLGISAYRFAEDTGITRNTVYSLKNNPLQFPSGDIFDRIISTYKVRLDDIVEWVPEESGNND